MTSSGRMRRDPMANVVRRTWTEAIDDKAFAAIAEFSETWHGMIFAASTFMLGELTLRPWTDKRAACERVNILLEEQLRAGVHSDGGRRFNRHGMPMVGKLRDLRR